MRTVWRDYAKEKKAEARERTARELYGAAMPIQDHIDDYWDQLNPGKVERFQNALAAAREAWGWED